MEIKEMLFLLTLPILVISCAGDTEIHKVLDENGNLVEEYSRRTKDYAKEGLYTMYYQGMDKVYKQAFYENDTLHGVEAIFFESGDTQEVATLVHGIYHGPMREYHPNGKISRTLNYMDGKLKGKLSVYYPSGELKGEYNYNGDNNLENGPFIEYYPDGKTSTEGSYLNGKEHGELKEYDESGELVRRADCTSGICITSWKKEDEEK